MDEKRFIALEERSAWLENEIARQGEELARALTEIGRLRDQIRLLYSGTAEPAAVRPWSEETPPPHY